jgi:acetyl-CoA synthetase
MRCGRAQDDEWARFIQRERNRHTTSFEEHWQTYNRIFAERPPEDGPPVVWRPSQQVIDASHLGRLMRQKGFRTYEELHRWSVTNRSQFWGAVLSDLEIDLGLGAQPVLAPGKDLRNPQWFPDARLNIAELCFAAPPDQTAIVFAREGDEEPRRVSYRELQSMARKVALGLVRQGFEPGQAIALYMPMTVECVAAYLGIVLAGCVVVSIADSFAPPQIKKRLDIANARAVITVETSVRNGKKIDLYRRVKAAVDDQLVIVVGGVGTEQRSGYAPSVLSWSRFIDGEELDVSFQPDPAQMVNVLFSSGTTGTPKAIPWTHLTPLKCAMDGRFHQDIHDHDVVAWPTNIGWMMGPWLIFATLLNRATMALFEGAPSGGAFCRFVEAAEVTMLGVVPTLVKAWRSSEASQKPDWSKIRVFSSTGEPSNQEDYLWLMFRTDYRAPIIEYCGGTEIGGGYITGTVVQPACPATFTTPALGLDLAVLSSQGKDVEPGRSGEVFLAPPSIGLSQRLLNGDHEAVYYIGVPTHPVHDQLRRHGDRLLKMHGGCYRAHGRTDDTMNLGGIKIGSVELERALELHPAVTRCAAVGVQKQGEGADRLVVFVLPGGGFSLDATSVELGELLKKQVNPLFRIHEVVVIDELPLTASNKLMRRRLREKYLSGSEGAEAVPVSE